MYIRIYIQETERCYTCLTPLTMQIPTHDVLLIGRDFNAQLGQNGGFKQSFHKLTYYRATILKGFLLENKLLLLNTHFQNRKCQYWTHKSPNYAMSQMYYIIIRSVLKTVELITHLSDHRIISENIRMSLRFNNKKYSNVKHYNWTTLKTDT